MRGHVSSCEQYLMRGRQALPLVMHSPRKGRPEEVIHLLGIKLKEEIMWEGVINGRLIGSHGSDFIRSGKKKSLPCLPRKFL